MKKIIITTENIFEACFFADDVLLEIRMRALEYDLITLEKKSNEVIKITEEIFDLMTMWMTKGMEIQEVDDLSVSDIKEKYLYQYLPLARKFFRGEYPCPYIFSKEVSDAYLDNLLCVRFRDLLRIIVIRETALNNQKKK
jgi:hypothetical protein